MKVDEGEHLGTDIEINTSIVNDFKLLITICPELTVDNSTPIRGKPEPSAVA